MLATATADLVAAAVSAALGLWLLLGRRKWAADVYALETLGRVGQPIVVSAGILFLVAAAWLGIDALT